MFGRGSAVGKFLLFATGESLLLLACPLTRFRCRSLARTGRNRETTRNFLRAENTLGGPSGPPDESGFPLQRFETLYEGTVLLSPAIQQPLMRFAALQSFMNRKLATYSVSCSHHDFLVSKKPSWFLRFCRPLLHLQSIGSSSPALFVLFRVRFRSEPVVHADMFNTVLEVSFSIATSI